MIHSANPQFGRFVLFCLILKVGIDGWMYRQMMDDICVNIVITYIFVNDPLGQPTVRPAWTIYFCSIFKSEDGQTCVNIVITVGQPRGSKYMLRGVKQTFEVYDLALQLDDTSAKTTKYIIREEITTVLKGWISC